MAENLGLDAQLRTELGSSASRKQRRVEDTIPAVIYGGDAETQHLTLEHRKVIKALENEAFYSQILSLVIDGKKQKAVLKAVHRHPFKAKVLHMDFLRITGKEKITMRVPIHFLGEDVAPGVKEGGIVSHSMTDVEISCLPADLPQHIDLDLSNLELDKSLHLSDLPLPKGVEIIALTHGADHDLPVAAIHVPRAVVEEVEETPTEEGAEGEAGAEGEDKAEGDNDNKES